MAGVLQDIGLARLITYLEFLAVSVNAVLAFFLDAISI